MTMTIFHAVNMPMGFVVLFAFSTSFSSSENHVMHPVMEMKGSDITTMTLAAANLSRVETFPRIDEKANRIENIKGRRPGTQPININVATRTKTRMSEVNKL